MKNRGIHIIGDLHNCDLTKLAVSKIKLRQLIKETEKKSCDFIEKKKDTIA